MEELNLKILLVGDSDVGKTSLLSKYTDDKFPDTYLATVGVEFRVKSIIKKNFKVNLQIWDTAGQERFRSVTKNFFYNADGILFVYDITNRDSFDGVKSWIQQSESLICKFEKILIGNKCDLEKDRDVSKKEVEDFCKENDLFTLDASAKEGNNVIEAFETLTELIFDGKNDEDIINEYGKKLQSISTLSKFMTKNRRNSVKCC